MDGLPPIHRAARSGVLEEVLRMIHQDPQVANSIDSRRNTPLYYACVRGHVSVVAALVDHGANIDHQNGDDGHTALIVACHEGHVPIVELLMTTSYYQRMDVVRCLLQYPSVLSTIDHHDNNGYTALHYACSEDYHEIVRMLLQAGADPMKATNSGRTAMDIASGCGHQPCVMLLKEWDRSYTITKARRLCDAFYRYHQQGIAIAAAASASSSDVSGGGGHANHKRSGVEAAIPTYLKGRVEGEQPLPKVEMVDGYEEGSLVESVLEYVMCGGLKGELFVELMEMLGKTGYRKEGMEEDEGNDDSDDDDDEEEEDSDDCNDNEGEEEDESEVEEEEEDDDDDDD